MKNFFLVIILNSAFLILHSFCFGQNVNNLSSSGVIDSLVALLKTDRNDTIKVIHLCQLTRENELAGNYGKGIRFGTEALEIASKLGFKKGIANANSSLANIHLRQADYPRAIDCYHKALKIYEELKNKKAIAVLIGLIGNVYLFQGDYSKTLEYYFKALKINTNLNDKTQIATNLINIGSVYYKQKDFPKALGNYFLALKMAEELGDKTLQVNVLGNIGSLQSEIKDYPKAFDYNFKSLKMAEELGNTLTQANALCNIGNLYTYTGKFEEAEKYLKRAILIDNKIGALDQLRGDEEYLSELYDTMGLYELALIYYKKSVSLKDTIFSQENKKELVRKELNYEFDKKEAITKAENEKQQAIAEEKNRRQKLVLVLVYCVLILVFVFAGFVFRSLRITRKQKQIIEIKNTETEKQKKIIEEKNKDITDSIHYAKRIQNALLRDEEHTSLHLPEHFILFMPKDIVSGDFYWGAEKNEYWYFAAVDCTGHGVPGAVMSMLGISFLNDIVVSEQLLNPAEVLDRLRDKVVKELRQTGEAGGSKDGMDISLARLNLNTNVLHWAGANNPLNLIRNGKFEEIKADKQPIGYYPENHPFTNHEIQLQKGDSIYIYSDGYADQFGGPKGKKFKYNQLEDLIIANYHLPLKDQKEIFKKSFTKWKGTLEQVDDVCVFGVKI